MFILRQKRFLAFCLFAAVAGTIPLVTLAARNHHDAPIELATMALIGMVCGLGLALLIALVVFTVYRSFFTVAPAIALAPYEDVLASMPANSFRDGEARGGTLFVTQRRLIFVPHRFNFQLDSTFIPWDDIRGCLPIPANPLTQTTLTIELRGGGEQQLVVYNRQALIGYIERMRRLVESERAVASGVLLLALGIGHLASRASRSPRPAAPPEPANDTRASDGANDGARRLTSETIVQATEIPAEVEPRDAKTVVTNVPMEILRSPSDAGEAAELINIKTVVTNAPIEIFLSPDNADRTVPTPRVELSSPVMVDEGATSDADAGVAQAASADAVSAHADASARCGALARIDASPRDDEAARIDASAHIDTSAHIDASARIDASSTIGERKSS